MLLDLKTACRELAKSRWFTGIVVLTLALGIGANTAIFAVANRLLLNPLPYPDADRLVFLNLGSPQRGAFGFPTPGFVASAWREQATTLDGVEAFSPLNVLAYDANGARVLRGIRMSPGLPAFFGVAPLLGRGFVAADAEAGAPPVVMLSYEAWQRDYGGARDLVGRALTLDDVSHTIVGVLPPRWNAFAGGLHPEIAVPLPLARAALTDGFPTVFARLRPDVTAEAATAELDAILARALAESPRLFFGGEVLMTRIAGAVERMSTGARDTLFVLLGAVGLLLLVACSNVANLLLARGAARARELALRLALGASSWRLVRSLFAECLVLALAAGIVGVAFGWLTLRVLMGVRPGSLYALDDVGLDASMLAFTLGVSVLTALLFGLAPALQLASSKLGHALRHGASGVLRGGGPRVRKLLVAAQMAISVVLLVSAGLLVRSVINLQRVDVGFDPVNLFSAQLALPRERYQEPGSRDVAAEQLLERLRVSPGVASVTQVFMGPPYSAPLPGNIEIRGMTLSDADARTPRGFDYVRPNFFSTAGIRVIEGRTFTDEEVLSGAAIVLNRAAAQRHWPNGGALGAEVKYGRDYWMPVVGIVDNVIAGGLTQSQDLPMYYMPYQTRRAPLTAGGPPGITLVVRAADDPAVAIASLRAATRELDPEIAVREVLLSETLLARSIDAPRFNMALLSTFAVIALVLAAVGLAAVIGYEITERRHEIGVRMALGARAENVRRLAMRHGLAPAFAGVVCGVPGALAVTGFAQSMLYGIAPRDPLTFVGVVGLLVVVAFGAAWLPARRATRVDPMQTLRAD